MVNICGSKLLFGYTECKDSTHLSVVESQFLMFLFLCSH